MLNISRNSVAKQNVNVIRKQKNLLGFIACLMFISGILFIVFPFYSEALLSVILGGVLICSSIAWTAIMLKNRTHNLWPVVSGVLVSIAYMMMGYFFITSPEIGIFTLATLLAGLFLIGGLIRIMAWFRQRKEMGREMLLIIGVLDLFIGWCFISATPQASVVMVSFVVGIELIVSACSCFALARQLSKLSA
ncbi:HdeD family acid-resistance protein [Enterobacter sp. Bisph1]|uniref:HdeD family acid-resistance protein n=1 Tax=Enterobacter sp. Bisph1 TaxID=1274399 RepID=UPI00057BE95D|nr:HdeD family acid-resistance protein [Enterobacter sp. Bisph1]